MDDTRQRFGVDGVKGILNWQNNGVYRTGAVGLTQKGLVTVLNLGTVPLKERSRLKKLVTDENNDRNALYKEIARANGHPEWEGDIRKTFAQTWISEAKSNVWYQDGKGEWKQK